MSDWTDYTYSLDIHSDAAAPFLISALLIRRSQGIKDTRKLGVEDAVESYDPFVSEVRKRNPDMTNEQVSQRALHEWWTAIEEGREPGFGPEQETAGRSTPVQYENGARVRDRHGRVWRYIDTWKLESSEAGYGYEWQRSYASLLADLGPLTTADTT